MRSARGPANKPVPADVRGTVVDSRRALREFEDPAMRRANGGYDWSLLPLAEVSEALRVASEDVEGLVRVRIPGIAGEFVAHRSFVERLVATRSVVG